MINKPQIADLLCVLHSLYGTELYPDSPLFVAYLGNKEIRERISELYNRRFSHQRVTWLCDKLKRMSLVAGVPGLKSRTSSENFLIYWRK